MMFDFIDEVIGNERYDTYRIPFHRPMITMTTEETQSSIPNVPKVYSATHLGLNFTDKGSYLSWRVAWARRYQKLSVDIRKAKNARADLKLSFDERSIAQHNAAMMGGLATSMLLLLEEGKLQAATNMGKPRARRYHHCPPPPSTGE